ncbi:MAG: 30S ribosomal protein S13 [Candidatus Micrarchaeota archaeon]
MENLEQNIAQQQKYGVKNFMLNRQKSYQSSTAQHLISTDLQYATKQDIEHEKDSQSWKGFRHSYGQKVRGQRTRSTGRQGMTVGVMRKAIKAAGVAAAAADAKGSKAEKK